MAQLINPDGHEATVLPLNGKEFTLTELQAHVGGFVEIVGRARNGKELLYMLADEDGRFKSLPLNKRASMIVGRQIIGNALLLTGKELGTR